ALPPWGALDRSRPDPGSRPAAARTLAGPPCSDRRCSRGRSPRAGGGDAWRLRARGARGHCDCPLHQGGAGCMSDAPESEAAAARRFTTVNPTSIPAPSDGDWLLADPTPPEPGITERVGF